MVDDALQRRVPQQLRFPFRDRAGIADHHFLGVAVGGLRQECSQTLRQHDVGMHLDVLFVRHRRNVHRVLDDAVLQVFLDLECDLVADRFLCLARRAGDVR